jgi:hypothetical protein
MNLAKWFGTEEPDTIEGPLTKDEPLQSRGTWTFNDEQISRLGALMDILGDLQELTALYRHLKRHALDKRDHRWVQFDQALQNIEHPEGTPQYNDAKQDLLQRREDGMKAHDLRAFQTALTSYFNSISNLRDPQPTSIEQQQSDALNRRFISEYIVAERCNLNDFIRRSAKKRFAEGEFSSIDEALRVVSADVHRIMGQSSGPVPLNAPAYSSVTLIAIEPSEQPSPKSAKPINWGMADLSSRERASKVYRGT